MSDRNQYIDGLISEGILSRNYDRYWNEVGQEPEHREVLYFTYERFGDHLIVNHLIANCVDKSTPEQSFQQNPKLQSLTDNKRSVYNIGLLEALAIQLPEKVGVELHQVLPHLANTQPLASAFLESLLWRKLTAYTKESYEYFDKIAHANNKYLHHYLNNTLLMVTALPGHPFNSDFLHKRLSLLTMVDRDAKWSTYIHYNYTLRKDEPSAVQRLVDWAWSPAANEDLSNESIRLASQAIAWFLTSSHRLLRDSATKSLVSLLENRIPILIRLLKAFEGVNDPYIYERLWAVAYGCTLRTKNTKDLKPLSEYTFQIIFNQDKIYPHILLRDYARGVIEYATYIGVVNNLNLIEIRPPYKSEFPDYFPTVDEIDAKFKLDYKSPEFKPYHWSQNTILDSMTTEYGRGVGAYGDFGRYVFEGPFRGWEKEIDVSKLSNLAIEWIFEKYGYDVDRLGEFDRQIKERQGDRHSVRSERIGKKYQWIAMHELLALVSDQFVHRKQWGEYEEMPYQGPWEPNVRDIDPSVLIRRINPDRTPIQWLNFDRQFDWTIPHADWIALHDDFPDPTKLVEAVNPDTKEEWLLLESHQEWREPTLAGEDENMTPKKNLWYQIKAYIIEEKDYARFIKWGKKQDFMGNWMPGIYERYQLFSREYYWSPAYKQLTENSEADEEVESPWRNVNEDDSGKFIGRVMVPVEEYVVSNKQDHFFGDSSRSIYKPNAFIFDKMGLQYTDIEGQLADSEGRIVCIDPSVEQPGSLTLLMHKSNFMEMLRQHGLRIFWTVLGEKAIYRTQYNGETYSRTITSGIIHYSNGKLKFDHIIYDEMEKYKKREKAYQVKRRFPKADR